MNGLTVRGLRKLITPRLATLLIVVVGAGSCGGVGSVPASDGPESAPSLPHFLSLGTAPPGGAFYVVGGALAATLQEDPVGSGWQVTAEATKGTQENIRRLTSGELDFALANSSITYFAIRGEGWERPHELRSVMTLAPNVGLFLSPEGSGVDSLADLSGKRVVLGPAGAGFRFFLEPILAAHGVAYEDVVELNATQAGAVDLLGDGSAAAAFLGGAVPTASIVQATASGGIHFLPFDPEARAQLIADYPFFRPATLPAGTYRGQDEVFEGLDVGSMHLITSTSAPEELVYAVTRALYEGRESVVARHPAGKSIQPGNVVRDTGTPFHPGAIRYYREIGIWPTGE
jgi:hypothetical protein